MKKMEFLDFAGEAEVDLKVRKCEDDVVNHPAHYTQGGIECIDALEAALTPDEFRGYLKGNTFKYLWRTNHKDGAQDLEKANWYLGKLRQERD